MTSLQLLLFTDQKKNKNEMGLDVPLGLTAAGQCFSVLLPPPCFRSLSHSKGIALTPVCSSVSSSRTVQFHLRNLQQITKMEDI